VRPASRRVISAAPPPAPTQRSRCAASHRREVAPLRRQHANGDGRGHEALGVPAPRLSADTEAAPTRGRGAVAVPRTRGRRSAAAVGPQICGSAGPASPLTRRQRSCRTRTAAKTRRRRYRRLLTEEETKRRGPRRPPHRRHADRRQDGHRHHDVAILRQAPNCRDAARPRGRGGWRHARRAGAAARAPGRAPVSCHASTDCVLRGPLITHAVAHSRVCPLARASSVCPFPDRADRSRRPCPFGSHAPHDPGPDSLSRPDTVPLPA